MDNFDEPKPQDKAKKIYEELTSVSVDVKALRIDWILNDDHGHEFLKAIYSDGKLQNFENTSVVIMIEYIFNKFRRIRNMLIFFTLLQLIFLLLSIFAADFVVHINNQEKLDLC